MNRDEHKAKDITCLLPKDKNKRPMNLNCYVFLISWIIFQSSEAFPKSTEVADCKKILTSSETETIENLEKDVEVRWNQLSSKPNIIYYFELNFTLLLFLLLFMFVEVRWNQSSS
jgi:hypothetical protein